jgi:pimeloyl-ACP methyl ester carboxylesterase
MADGERSLETIQSPDWRGMPARLRHIAYTISTRRTRHSVSMTRHLVLLHGLGRTARSMAPVAREASRRGYSVHNLGYPSRTARVAELAEQVAHAVQRIAPEEQALDFVTHSLGGILLRAAVDAGILPVERIRRAVLLAPPNRGSEVAERLARVPVVRRIPGRPLAELGIGSDAVVARLGPVPFDCGVIAGNRSIEPHLSWMIPGPNDGKVAVARASADGVRDFLVVPHSHPFIMNARAVHEQIFHFLEHGRFAAP